MPQIHPTAHVGDQVTLADDVVIGRHCVLEGEITIGAGTRLIGNVYVEGPTTIGCGNTMYPFVCLGFSGQDLKWDHDRPGAGLTIGDDNTFRESVTIHRATNDDVPTRVGDRNYWMGGSHAAHDVHVHDDCILVNNFCIAGHADIADGVVGGGNGVVHQGVRVGRGCMISGTKGMNRDVPPFMMVTGSNVVGSINLIGMRRKGMAREDIDAVKWAYRILIRDGHSLPAAIELLRERAGEPMIDEYIEFAESSTRGICFGEGNLLRA